MLRFSLLGIPITIEWMFWAIGALFGLPFFQAGGRAGTFGALIWMTVWFVSFIIHEMGHALVYRKFGGHNTRIHLYGFGGYASSQGYFSRKESILISAAGPGVEIAFGCVALLLRRSELTASWNPYFLMFLGLFSYICLFWGFINLLPVLPLDGGRITDAALGRGITTTAKIGCIAGGITALVFVSMGNLFAGVFFGFLAFQNYQITQGGPSQIR